VKKDSLTVKKVTFTDETYFRVHVVGALVSSLFFLEDFRKEASCVFFGIGKIFVLHEELNFLYNKKTTLMSPAVTWLRFHKKGHM